MANALEKWRGEIARLRVWWTRHHETVMRLAIAFMAAVALVRLAYEFWRLVAMAEPNGANDLRLLYDAVQHWFARTSFNLPGYPPASYVILWLPFGWLDVWYARWLWALTSVLALSGLTYFVVKHSGAQTRLERAFWILTLLSIYPIAITIGNGQLGIHVLVAVIGSMLLLQRGRTVTWRGDFLAALLMLVALTKPNLAIPFLWLVFFVPGRIRPFFLVTAGYVLLTVFAAAFQPDPLWVLVSNFFKQSADIVSSQGAAHLGTWMIVVGLKQWIGWGSVVVFGALGLWVWLNRRADLWLLLGVSAIIARLWTYHRMYDDLLILLPMVALFRIAKQGASADGSDAIAGILFACGWFGLEVPGTLARLPFPWSLPYEVGQSVIWIAMLIFLMVQTRRVAQSLIPSEVRMTS